jgi:serine/threonine protein kinase
MVNRTPDIPVVCRCTHISIAEHEACYKNGIVQRDISLNNIILSGGQGHLIDFDHSKFTSQMATLELAESKQISQSLRSTFLLAFDRSIVERAEAIARTKTSSTYLLNLKEFYRSDDDSDQPPLSPKDLGWPEASRAQAQEYRLMAIPGFL